MSALFASIPANWHPVTLADVATVKYGKALAADDRKENGGVPVYASGGLVGRHDKALCKGPSIVIGRKGTVGSSTYVDGPFWAIDTTFFLDEISPHLNLKFLSYAIQLFGLERYKIVVGVPGINRGDLERFQFPLPPLSEQQRIVEILQEAEQIRRLHAIAKLKTTELILPIFKQIFGDPNRNERGFPLESLSSLGALDRGRSRHRPRDDASLYGGPYPFIQTGDVAQSNGWIDTYSQTYSEEGLRQSKLWPAGTLCITIAANIGATAILTFDACFPDSIVGFIPRERITAEYVRWWLFAYQAKLEAQAPAGAQKNINLKILRAIQIPIPPIKLQEEFKRRISTIRQNIFALNKCENGERILLASLQAHAFTGNLTLEWRNKNEKILHQETVARDVTLKTMSSTHSLQSQIVEIKELLAHRSDGAYAELTREQYNVLEAVERSYGGVDYPRWFTAQEVAKSSLSGPLRGNPHAIENHLAVLAARGLVIALSREEEVPGTGEVVYGNAYRLRLKDFEPAEGDLREAIQGDDARQREMERLVGRLTKEPMS